MINVILLYLSITQFSPMTKLDPKLAWYTLESEHFLVSFSNKGSFDEQEKLAREIVWYCEDAHTRLVPYMRWRPKQKTNVVIGDFYDYVSGWATPFPHNTIFVGPTFDKEMKVNYNDWLQQLIIHEYAHVLNMDMVYGIPRFFRRIFGKIIVPNTVMPLFLNEGFSVYNESKFTGFGRSKSSYYQMMMRSAVLDNQVFSIDKCVTYHLAQYPSGETPYFYGSMFYEYLSDKYGEDKLAKYSNWLSSGIPLFYNTQAKRVFGKSFYSLWRDFKQETKEEYSNQIQAIQTIPVTQTTQLTHQGFNTESPVFSKDGNKIYFVLKTSHDYPLLKEYDLTTNKTKILLEKNISSQVRLSKDGSKLIFSIRDYYQNFYRYDDFYIYDLENKKLKRLTQGLRVSDADFSPTKDQIVFVKNELGQTNLFVMNLENREVKQLTHSEDYTQYSQMRFSPDGNKIAVAIWKLGGHQDIFIYDLANDWLIPVTQDQSLDIEPCWSNDGEYLLFSSDRTNVFNIFAYHLKSKKLYQVTNVLTGAFSPVLTSDNTQLVLLLYSSKGYDVHTTYINLDSLRLLESVITDDSVTISYPDQTTYQSTLYHYNPFPSILPKFWLPLAMFDLRNQWSIGAMTYGADALFQHQYLIQAYYNIKSKKPTVYLDYTLDKFYPTILISAIYDQGKINGSISNRFAFIKNAYQQYLTVSYLLKKDYQFYSGLGLFYQFNNTKYYPYSIGLEQGRYLGIKAQIYDKILFSQRNRTNVSMVFAEYINLPFNHHILMLNTIIGFTWGGWYYYVGGPKASFRIRGHTTRISSHHGVSLTAEYRFPLFWIERGLGTFPVFFQNISGNIFFDIGKGFNSLSELRHSSTVIKGAGCELSLRTLFFYEIPVKFTFGVASDLSQVRVSQIYFQVTPIIPFVSNKLLNEFDN